MIAIGFASNLPVSFKLSHANPNEFPIWASQSTRRPIEVRVGKDCLGLLKVKTHARLSLFARTVGPTVQPIPHALQPMWKLVHPTPTQNFVCVIKEIQ